MSYSGECVTCRRPPFLIRRLEAVRCASRYVASIITTFFRLRRRPAPHDLGEDPHPAPPDPAVVERLRRSTLTWRITPSQVIAIDEDYAIPHTPIIDPRSAMAPGKKGHSRSICASVSQKRLLIITPVSSEA